LVPAQTKTGPDRYQTGPVPTGLVNPAHVGMVVAEPRPVPKSRLAHLAWRAGSSRTSSLLM